MEPTRIELATPALQKRYLAVANSAEIDRKTQHMPGFARVKSHHSQPANRSQRTQVSDSPERVSFSKLLSSQRNAASTCAPANSLPRTRFGTWIGKLSLTKRQDHVRHTIASLTSSF